MKGKIVYTTTVEKEIEIPDEIIAICETQWKERTNEQDFALEDYLIEVWKDIDHLDKIGIYYEEDGKTYYVTEY